jgi:O-Antigen ligase
MSPGSASARRPPVLGWASRLVFAGAVALVTWGVLAFGSPYPWAYIPLAAGCLLVGVTALWVARGPQGGWPDQRRVVLALGGVALAGVVQLVPLPPSLCDAVSPAGKQVLLRTDLTYAALPQATEGTGASAFPAHPLSIDPAATRRALLLLVPFTVLFWGLTRYCNRVGAARFVSWIVGLGVLVALIGIVQKAVLGDDPFEGMKIYGFWAPTGKLSKPFGPFVNKNHYAGWMVMALPVALGYFLAQAEVGLRQRHGWRDRLLWLSSPQGGRLQLAAFAVVIMGAALVMTLSRSGIACFGMAMAIAVLVAARHQSTISARVGMVAVLGALLLAPLFWANVNLARRFSPKVDDSVQLRRDIWGDTFKIISDFPLAGTGLDTLGRAMQVYQNVHPDQNVREAHNDYLQIAAEGGLLAGVPAAAAMALLAIGIRRRFTEGLDDVATSWTRFGAATGLAAIAIQSLVEFSLQMPGNTVVFVVLCVVAVHRPPPADPSRDAIGR